MVVHKDGGRSYDPSVFNLLTNNNMVENKEHIPEGQKFDEEKPDYFLLPPHALHEVVKVLTFGAKKYAPNNWKFVKNGDQRYFSAAMRHLWAVARGETHDPETGCHHYAHAICCVMFALDNTINQTKQQ